MLSAPLAAQREMPTGSRIGRPAPAAAPENPKLSDEDRALRTTFDYARCLVQYDEKEFRPLLSLEPKIFNEKQRKALIRPACLRSGELTMPGPLLRGAIFRAFYLKDWAQSPIAAFAQPVNYFQFVERENPSQVAAATMLDFASCVIRADQANARAFVVGMPGENKFEEALRALIPRMGPCMPVGIEVQFSKSTLVGYLSEAVYWEAKTAAESSDAKAGGS